MYYKNDEIFGTPGFRKINPEETRTYWEIHPHSLIYQNFVKVIIVHPKFIWQTDILQGWRTIPPPYTHARTHLRTYARTHAHTLLRSKKKRKKSKKSKKERVSKQKLLKGSHQGQKVAILSILNHGGRQYFSVFHGPSTWKSILSALYRWELAITLDPRPSYFDWRGITSMDGNNKLETIY